MSLKYVQAPCSVRRQSIIFKRIRVRRTYFSQILRSVSLHKVNKVSIKGDLGQVTEMAAIPMPGNLVNFFTNLLQNQTLDELQILNGALGT